MRTAQVFADKSMSAQLTEMADVHCHLDLIHEQKQVSDAISLGVRTIITNGVNLDSCTRALEIADGKHIFPMLGVDPEHAGAPDPDIDKVIELARNNRSRIAGIGEVGLDYGVVKDTVPVERQKEVFGRFMDLAQELRLPISIHSRGALDDIIEIIREKGAANSHIHFFEGNVQQAKAIERLGCMISVPPLQTSRRSKVIREIPIDSIMAESDSPVVGASPKAVETSIRIIADAKGLEFAKAADATTRNARRFFKLNSGMKLMRYDMGL